MWPGVGTKRPGNRTLGSAGRADSGSVGGMDPSRLRQWTSMSAEIAIPELFPHSPISLLRRSRLENPAGVCFAKSPALAPRHVRKRGGLPFTGRGTKQKLPWPDMHVAARGISSLASRPAGPCRTLVSWKPGIRHGSPGGGALAAGWLLYIHLREWTKKSRKKISGRKLVEEKKLERKGRTKANRMGEKERGGRQSFA